MVREAYRCNFVSTTLVDSKRVLGLAVSVLLPLLAGTTLYTSVDINFIFALIEIRSSPDWFSSTTWSSQEGNKIILPSAAAISTRLHMTLLSMEDFGSLRRYLRSSTKRRFS